MIYLLIFLIAWSAIGVSLALAFRRLGHNFLIYATLGVALGPLVLLLIVDATRHGDVAPSRVLRGHRSGPGELDVLIGLDGSDEGLESTAAALDMVRSAVGFVRLATVLDLETARARDSFRSDEERVAHQEHARKALRWPDAELVLLGGRADRALIEYGASEGVDLIIVSHRRHHFLAILLGSTVARLARRARIALLIGPAVEPVEQNNVTPLSGRENLHVH